MKNILNRKTKEHNIFKMKITNVFGQISFGSRNGPRGPLGPGVEHWLHPLSEPVRHPLRRIHGRLCLTTDRRRSRRTVRCE